MIRTSAYTAALALATALLAGCGDNGGSTQTAAQNPPANPPPAAPATATPPPAPPTGAPAAPPPTDTSAIASQATPAATPASGAPDAVQSSYYAQYAERAKTGKPADAASASASAPAPASAASASAPPSMPAGAADTGPFAKVISVQPVKQAVNQEQEECRDVRVTHTRRPKDEHQIAGTVIGAIAGGVVGHQIGGGRGRDLATVAGAVGGGVAGKKIQEGNQRRNTYTTVEHRCRKVKQPVEQVTAYDVVYEYLGTTHQVRLDHDPGDRVQLPVRGIE